MISILVAPMLFSLPIMGEENSFNISMGTHQQYSALDSGYGKFLKDRYGASGLTTNGRLYRFLFKFSDNKNLWVGLELGEQSGKIKYKDLNGVSRVNNLSLTWVAMLINYPLDEVWQLEGGFGIDVLTREFYGYKDNDITYINISDNSGRSDTETRGMLSFGQITYNFFNGRGSSFEMAVSYRYNYSEMTIRSTDERPALNDKGVPVRTTFDVGGHLGLIQFGINF